jgi:hypothetical protein
MFKKCKDCKGEYVPSRMYLIGFFKDYKYISFVLDIEENREKTNFAKIIKNYMDKNYGNVYYNYSRLDIDYISNITDGGTKVYEVFRGKNNV